MLYNRYLTNHENKLNLLSDSLYNSLISLPSVSPLLTTNAFGKPDGLSPYT